MRKTCNSLLAILVASSAYATPFTTTSPTSEGALPAGVTQVGGIVMDAVGLNGTRIVAQRAASGLYIGYAGSNPFNIGTQSGLTAALLGQLGGGLSELAIRITLWDGDTASGNFDFNQNSLLLNGINVGNWSSANAQVTDSTGVTGGSFSGGGFRNNTLDTGWFNLTGAGLLTSVYNSIVAANSLTYAVLDVDPYDNYYDFTQGVSGSLVDVELPPVIQPPTSGVPDAGSTLSLLGLGVAGLAGLRRKLLA